MRQTAETPAVDTVADTKVGQNMSLGVLTKRQRQVLEVLQKMTASQSYPPSVRELAEALQLRSPSSIKHHLDVLEEKGYLRRAPKSPRALEVLNPATADPLLANGAQASLKIGSAQQTNSQAPTSSQKNQQINPPETTPAAQIITLSVGISDEQPATAVPLVGRIAAGNPILAEQQTEDVYTIPRRFTGKGELFMLQVSGESMREAAICDGDWVVVRRQSTANNGQFVAALLDGEATVKEFSRQNGQTWLLPHNPDYSPIDGTFAQVLGVVVTVIRAL